jgi:hypothetical protein
VATTTKKKTARFARPLPSAPEPAAVVRWRSELKRRCESRTGLTFNDAQLADLQELTRVCAHYADPGAEGRRAPLFMAEDWRPTTQHEVLCALVELVEDVWREAGGKGAGSWFDLNENDKNGPLVRLLFELFKFGGVNKPPSPRALRRALQRVRAGRTRPPLQLR